MPYLFEYTEMKYGGHFIDSEEGVSIQGKLVDGELCLGDSIYLRTESGDFFEGEVVRFVESFDDWLGLPFYDKVSADNSDSGAFCVEVHFENPQGKIVCPGSARPSIGNTKS